MKLASALSERSDLQTRLSQLEVRLNSNAKVQEGEEPSEDPKELLKELNSITKQLEALISKINLTNSLTKTETGETITELLARRDVLQKKNSVLRSFLTNAADKVNRYSKTEIKILSTVNVASLQKDVDKNAKQLRELDEKIQELNWTTELL